MMLQKRLFAFLMCALASCAGLPMASAACAIGRVLRVCADPANLPYSSEHEPGFENKIAEFLAHELRAELRYTWWAQRRGFFRETLNAGRCDVVMGVPIGLATVRTTKPYYRSTFAFVSRKDHKLANLQSIDDVRLPGLRIGVPLAGDDGANPAPVHALVRRGLAANLVGFPVLADYQRSLPGALDAVLRGEIDIALLWGPLAGAAAKRSHAALSVVPIREAGDGPQPFGFAIAFGVPRNDGPLAEELDRLIEREQAALTGILRASGVPLLPLSTTAAGERHGQH